MPEMLRCVFLNCCNLFPVGVVDRGPRSEAELNEKIANLAMTLRSSFGDTTPDLVGLCEVGIRELGRRVAEKVEPGAFELVWRTGQDPKETGLVALFKKGTFLRTPTEIKTEPTGPTESHESSRLKWLAVQLQLQIGNRGVFWFVVNHWKSWFKRGEPASEPDRMRSARQIGDFYLSDARKTSDEMLLVGDFNCEPGDRPFKSQARPNKLKGVRERALVLRERNRLAYFYNPMWRLLGEPDPWEMAREEGYVPPRDIGTHGEGLEKGVGWFLWDQFLVTKRMLRGGRVIMREGSLRIVRPMSDCSDHCAVAAEFDC